MGFLSKLFGNPLKESLGAIGDLLGKFVTDPDKKLEASLALAKIEQDLQIKLVEADMEYAKAQADVIKTEASSKSAAARNWRPHFMYLFMVIIAYNYVISPIFTVASLPVPEQMWDLIKIAMGGYVIGRSGEKIASTLSKK